MIIWAYSCLFLNTCQGQPRLFIQKIHYLFEVEIKKTYTNIIQQKRKDERC